MSISILILYILIIASRIQWTVAESFESCVYQILTQESMSDIELEFSRAALYEILDHNVTPDCKAGIAPRKETNDVSNLLDHLYVEGCVWKLSEVKPLLQKTDCSVILLNTSDKKLHKVFMAYFYNSDANDERKYTTFVYSCCKFQFKSESTESTAGASNYMRYLTKKQMIDSTKETLENMVKKSSSTTTTTQPKTTRGTKATTMPTLDPGSFTIDS